MLKIEVLSLFPEMMNGVLSSSIMGRAQDKQAVQITTHDLRNFAKDKHKTVDDRPFGGGPGMVLKCEPLVEAIEAIKKQEEATQTKTIYLTPEGRRFNQAVAAELAQEKRILLVSGHYEGIDERVRDGWIDDEVSIGDYIVTNGVIPALVIMDAVIRLLPGVLGNEESAEKDSFSGEGILEGPHYTRPAEFKGMKAPEILFSGNHEAIAAWRQKQGLKRTEERRKDLI
ncbi:MAG: tRNA (guanosine(37)-N1)-methyltransferase TrmD [Verrucomicrobiota bacterium]